MPCIGWNNLSKKILKMGMDEAGRGSLIGPMIVAGVILNESSEQALREAGVTDSKKLKRSAREKLFEKIESMADWYGTVAVMPEEIDRENLNKLTMEAFRKLACMALSDGFIPNMVIADAVGRDNRTINACIQLKIFMEKKADSKYTVVGAASIIAKVTRDREIEKIREQYGLVGSGYTGDRHTINWLMKNSNALPPSVIRHKWKSRSNPYYSKS
uniref:Ribonuclease n=1 Tax=Fervidicoccus fontis TaxID=683846 RepID=A0A7J3SMZ6_9CREN